MRHYEHWPIDALDHRGHCEGFAASGNAQQHLMLNTFVERSDQLLDRLWLIALRNVIAYELEIHDLTFVFVWACSASIMTAANPVKHTSEKYTSKLGARANRTKKQSRKKKLNKVDRSCC